MGPEPTWAVVLIEVDVTMAIVVMIELLERILAEMYDSGGIFVTKVDSSVSQSRTMLIMVMFEAPVASAVRTTSVAPSSLFFFQNCQP